MNSATRKQFLRSVILQRQKKAKYRKAGFENLTQPYKVLSGFIGWSFQVQRQKKPTSRPYLYIQYFKREGLKEVPDYSRQVKISLLVWNKCFGRTGMVEQCLADYEKKFGVQRNF